MNLSKLYFYLKKYFVCQYLIDIKCITLHVNVLLKNTACYKEISHIRFFVFDYFSNFSLSNDTNYGNIARIKLGYHQSVVSIVAHNNNYYKLLNGIRIV